MPILVEAVKNDSFLGPMTVLSGVWKSRFFYDLSLFLKSIRSCWYPNHVLRFSGWGTIAVQFHEFQQHTNLVSIFFDKGMDNKATQCNVPGHADLYGLWNQDIFYVDNPMLNRWLHYNFCCNWNIGYTTLEKNNFLYITKFFAEIFQWVLSTTVRLKQ